MQTFEKLGRSDRTNCDVCGRIVRVSKDADGGLFNKKGGYACGRCVRWGLRNKIHCPICRRPVMYVVYDDLCDCGRVTVIRKAVREPSQSIEDSKGGRNDGRES